MSRDAGSVAERGGPGIVEEPLPQIGQWELVWLRFRRHRLALWGARALLVLLFLALVGPLLAPPVYLPNPLAPSSVSVAAYRQRDQPPRLWPLDWTHVMGTDSAGNPVAGWVVDGARATLAISILGSLLASVVGMLLGGVAGFFGGVVDAVLMRLVDTMLAVPFLLLLVLLTLYLTDRSAPVYIALFGIIGWPGIARLVRGSALSLRQREFMDAARALGASAPRLILRHLLPNTLDVLIVATTLNIAVFVLAEASADFLQAGPYAVTWGKVLADAYNGVIAGYWWLSVFPGLALLLTVLAVNFLGDGLRDALDPASVTALAAAQHATPRRSSGGLPRVLHRSAVAMLPARAAALTLRRTASRAATLSPLRITPPAAVETRRVRAVPSLPWPVRLGPVVLAYLLAGGIFLYGHSPLRYAPNFAPPHTYGAVLGGSDFAMWPRRGGGMDAFVLDEQGRLVYRRFGAGGRPVRRQIIPFPGPASALTMAHGGGRVLGAWVGDSGQTVYAAYLGSRRSRIVALNPGGGVAEHPDVVALPGGFGVLFDWQPAGRRAYSLYLARIPAPAAVTRTLPAGDLEELIPAADYSSNPHGVLDGSGHLDLVYLNRTDRSWNIWSVTFWRFTVGGRSVSQPLNLGSLELLLQGPNGCTEPGSAPSAWPIDIKRVGDGSVWAAWETGIDCQVPHLISGTNTLLVAHWSPHGRLLVPPSRVDTQVDANGQAVALASLGHGGALFYTRPGQVEPYVLLSRFTSNGRPAGQERVAYDAGGTPERPEARSVRGRPVVLWQKVRLDREVLEGTIYRSAQPPDLLTHFGLNIGNLWGNLALLISGALAGGVPLTLFNCLLLLPLLPVWLLMGRTLPEQMRNLLFPVAVAVDLAVLLAIPNTPPGFSVMLGYLSGPAGFTPFYRWLAVAGGAGTAAWAGRTIFARQEAPVRAIAIALSALYFVAVMYSLVFIQGQINRI